jgi:hypothetical protein
MQQSGANIQAISPFNISPSDTIRWKPWGAASDLSPNPIDGSAAASNTEVIAINNSVRGLRVEAEIIAQKGDSVRVALPLETVAKELADVISRLLLAAKDKMPNKTLVQDGTKVFDSGELLRELRQSNRAAARIRAGTWRSLIASIKSAIYSGSTNAISERGASASY